MNSIARIGRAERLPLSTRTWFGYRQPMAWPSDNLGVDVSSYQGVIDFDQLKARGVKFVCIRSGISYGFTDERFAYNWREAKRVGLIRQAYHVLYPSEAAAPQVDRLFNNLAGDYGELPPVWDIELHQNQSKVRIENVAYIALDSTSQRYGEPAFCYSAKWFVDRYMGPWPWYEKYWWYLAGYLYANPATGYAEEHPGPVALPVGVPELRVLIHQTAGKYNAAGFGVQSKNIDTDRWIRGLAHLRAFANAEPEPTFEERLADHERRIRILEAKA